MESWCRICSRNDDFRRFPLFSVADVSQEVIAKMITSCTDTQVSSEDGLPQQICPDCLITLSLAYSFRRLCRRTDAKFRETFEPREPSAAEHMVGGSQPPRRSQSQVGEDGAVTYEPVPVIKEEVEFYEYECSAPPLEDQWVIQNPRTIQEGGGGMMTVLHGVSGQFHHEAVVEQEDDMTSMLPMITMDEGGHDPAEFGESSGTGGQRKKKHEPERFSKRIRRQESPVQDEDPYLVEMPDRTDNGLLEEVTFDASQQLVLNPAKQLQRCEYCRKKMKKPFKHRNGKCMDPKGKFPARPRCPYCHIVFVRSTSIPLHVQNSCRVYRELCATSQELPEPSDSTLTPVEEPAPVEQEPPPAPPTVKVKNNTKAVDVKPILQKSKPSMICRYCYTTFTKRGNLIKHQRDGCRVLNELDVEKLASDLIALEATLAEEAAAAAAQEEQPQEQDAADDQEETTCVYCTQPVGKKTRFQHHNGRCVIGRANADHPCPYCDAAFASRSNLLRHQRDVCKKYQEEHGTELTLTNAFQDLPVEDDTSHDETVLEADTTPIIKPEKKPKPPKPKEVVKRKKLSPIKPAPNEPANFVCSYCRKGFALRDTLIEHQRACNVRKQHKQVKCQFCGMMISNRGNLRKHQKVYCKQAPREEEQETVPEPKLKKPKGPKSLKKYQLKVKKEKQERSDSAAISPKPQPVRSQSRAGLVVGKHHNKIPCPHCDKTFQNNRQLRNHGRVCLKSRKMYKCKYCPAAFTLMSNMYRHIKLKRCTTGVNSGGRDSAAESLENGFQSDNSNLFSSTVHEPEPEVEPTPASATPEEDFEMILPDSSQDATLTENNNAREGEEKDQGEGGEPEEEQPSTTAAAEQPPEATLAAELQ